MYWVFQKGLPYFSSLSKSVCVSMLAYDCMGMQMQVVIEKSFKTILKFIRVCIFNSITIMNS